MTDSNNNQKLSRLEALEVEYETISQQLLTEHEISQQLGQKEKLLQKMNQKQQDLLSVASRSFEDLARTQKKFDKAIEEKDRLGFFRKRKTQINEIQSLQEAVRLSEMKAISARDELDILRSQKADLETEIDSLIYQLDKAKGLDRDALKQRRQTLKHDMDKLTDKDRSIRLRERKAFLLEGKSPPLTWLEDMIRE